MRFHLLRQSFSEGKISPLSLAIKVNYLEKNEAFHAELWGTLSFSGSSDTNHDSL